VFTLYGVNTDVIRIKKNKRAKLKKNTHSPKNGISFNLKNKKRKSDKKARKNKINSIFAKFDKLKTTNI
jgi:hypothetical protein